MTGVIYYGQTDYGCEVCKLCIFASKVSSKFNSDFLVSTVRVNTNCFRS